MATAQVTDAVPSPAASCVETKPHVVRTVEPVYPTVAGRLGVGGTVFVVVDLDEHSSITATYVLLSPSLLLNAAALTAARQSIYQTGTYNCVPVQGRYVFAVNFPQPGSTSRNNPACTLRVLGEAHFTVSLTTQSDYLRYNDGRILGFVVVHVSSDGKVQASFPYVAKGVIDEELVSALNGAVAQLQYTTPAGCPTKATDLVLAFNVVSGAVPADR